jgi:ADP-ribose pyrophosphatase YjhB (NUDIX family)
MSEAASSQSLLTRFVFQPIWRVQRSLTLGAQGIVLNDQHQVLLVKHGYRPGWCFPGGGVEKGETILTALTRELEEECGVIIHGTPELFGVYSNHRQFRNDHVTLFIVRTWTRPTIPKPNREIIAQDFFPIAAPPPDCAPATLRRLNELSNTVPQDVYW